MHFYFLQMIYNSTAHTAVVPAPEADAHTTSAPLLNLTGTMGITLSLDHALLAKAPCHKAKSSAGWLVWELGSDPADPLAGMPASPLLVPFAISHTRANTLRAGLGTRLVPAQLQVKGSKLHHKSIHI